MKLICPHGHTGPFTYAEGGYTLFWSVSSVDDEDKVIQAWGHYEVAEDGGSPCYLICGARLAEQDDDRYPRYCEIEFSIPDGYTLEFS